MTTIKCSWCGKVVPLTRDGKRPNQHRNGTKTCVGSGQLVATHEQLRTANPLNPTPKRK
jgi:hypothetical protein